MFFFLRFFLRRMSRIAYNRCMSNTKLPTSLEQGRSTHLAMIGHTYFFADDLWWCAECQGIIDGEETPREAEDACILRWAALSPRDADELAATQPDHRGMF